MLFEGQQQFLESLNIFRFFPGVQPLLPFFYVAPHILGKDELQFVRSNTLGVGHVPIL
jgi:hypothetical protein